MITINGNQNTDAENNLIETICDNLNVRYDFDTVFQNLSPIICAVEISKPPTFAYNPEIKFQKL